MVELTCTTCGKPLRIQTFTGSQIVVEDWYMGVDRYNGDDDLCKKCYCENGSMGKVEFNPGKTNTIERGCDVGNCRDLIYG